MVDVHEVVEVTYTDTVIDQASTSFVRYFLKTKFGRLLLLACVINMAAFALVVALGIREAFMLFVVGMIAALGPIYLVVIRFVYPRKFASALKQRLGPKAQVAVTSSGFSVTTDRRGFTLPWSEVKSILEFPEYFLLVISRLAFAVIPKDGLSVAAQQMIRGVSVRRGAA